MPQTIGKPLRRKEDMRLLTGRGRYSDDVNLPGQAYAVILRSPHAHARIRSIDTAAARAMPGVLAVLTGADVTADGLEAVPHTPIPMKPPADILLVNRDGSAHGYAPQALLPTDRVRYVGQQVVMVVAETIASRQGRGRAGRGGLRAAQAGHRDRGGGARPARRGSTTMSPMSASTPMSATSRRPRRRSRAPRTWRSSTPGCSASPACRSTRAPRSASTIRRRRRYTLHAGSGGVVRQKHELAGILGVPPDDVRVECGDVGGNFGTRNAFYPEFALVVWAAKRLGRPVKWTCERSEAFASDYQGRDQVIEAELALDDKGRFLALRGSVICNTGAHSVMYVPLVKCAELLTSVYRVPAAHVRARAALEQHAADQSLPQRRPARGDVRDRAADRSSPRGSSATTASTCAGAISFRRRRSPTPIRSA